MRKTLRKSKPVIGLVGGVAAGKSTVAREFARLGAAVVDGDAIGHQLLARPAVQREIRRRWGAGVFAHGGVSGTPISDRRVGSRTGPRSRGAANANREIGVPGGGRTGLRARGAVVDRAALGRIVFAHPRELAALNRILHPRIRREMKRQIAAARKHSAVLAVILDAAVLFEAGWDDLCSAVVFVHSSAAVRARRAAGKGWDRATWRKRENSQISLDKKRRNSDHVVDNSFSLTRLRDQVRLIFQQIVHVADRP